MKSRAILLCAVLLPALAASAILYSEAFAAPYQDDYHAIASFAADYQQLPTWKQKLFAIAAAQHNEYKLAFEHVVVAADLEATHHLNFLLLALLGDLTLLPTAFFLWLVYQHPHSDLAANLIRFLPISLLFFGLTYWEALDWAMSGLQNIAIVMFSLMALFFLAPRESATLSQARFLLACLAAALASFTSANGFLLAPIGLLILLPRRAYSAGLLWCLCFVVPFAAYLYHYVSMAPAPRHPRYYLTRPAFFLAFLGGVMPARWVAVGFGILVLAILVLAIRTRFDRVNPSAAWFTVWAVATGALVAWVRGATALSIASRYSIYSVMIVIFCYSFLDHYLQSHPARRWFYPAVLVASAVFCLAGNFHAYQKLAYRRSMVLAGIEHYCANPAANSPMIDPAIVRIIPQEQGYERRVLTETIHRGLYAPSCITPQQER